MKKDSRFPSRQEFAVYVVRTLRSAGFDAFWAGGCVRDRLLGKEPKDFDVATSARPEAVCRLFVEFKTLNVGVAFGVVVVVGPRRAGNVEVATFRRDANYSDGRHPDSVEFSTAEFDARRRDFTINGIFYDPIECQVVDYVGGQKDLANKLIRAIGDPDDRINEDKLRMLRAVRFSATLGFQIEPRTKEAVQRHAGELSMVSAERISEEMRRMLKHERRAAAVSLLRDTGLLSVILPELSGCSGDTGEAEWLQTLQILSGLASAEFPIALGALLRSLAPSPTDEPGIETEVNGICRRWRLSNDESSLTAWLVRHESKLRSARARPWPEIQRLLTHANAKALVELARAIAVVVNGQLAEIQFCEGKLALPREELDPPPLITGNDLIAQGFRPGKGFSSILRQVRDAQLESRISNRQDAIQLATKLMEPGSHSATKLL